jgi:hypothetical protein
MDSSENILAVFERRPKDRIPWNIRHEFWYIVNKAQGTLPPEYAGMSMLDVCKEWGASWRRYSGSYTDSFIDVNHRGDIEYNTQQHERSVALQIKTPYGALRQVSLKDERGFSSRHVEYLIKGVEDFKPLSYVLENIGVKFIQEVYDRMNLELGGHGILSYFFPRSPLQSLMINYAGVERTINLLFRHPSAVEGFMEAIKRYNDQFYEVLGSSPVKILNLGENIDVRITSPTLFKKYCLPIYQERSEYLHRKGKFVHIHIDGWAKPLLPFLKETGLDGVEALTVKPTGDMTIEDIKRTLGDEMVLLDGIPYIYFLPDVVSLRKFDAFVKKIIATFPDNLVLGISDELPPPSDESRVKRVTRIIDKLER